MKFLYVEYCKTRKNGQLKKIYIFKKGKPKKATCHIIHSSSFSPSLPLLLLFFPLLFWFSSVETFKWKLTDAIPHNLTAPEGSLFPPDILQHLFEADFSLLLFHLKLEAPMRRDEKVHAPRQGFDPRCHTLTDISTYIETCCSRIHGNKQDCSAG